MLNLSTISKNILLGGVLLALVFPLSTQAIIDTTIGGSLIANPTPKYPKPNEMLTISLTGYGVNLDDSRITWLVDDKVQIQGVAKTEFVVTMGPLGSKTKINAVVQTRTNRTLIKELIVQPGEVDLLYEAGTYVPSDYAGAPLPSLGSSVKVVAIPQMMYLGSLVRPETLTYEWRVNGRKLNEESGRGKDSISFIMPTKKVNIEVVAKSSAYNLEASNKITIATVEPEIILYPVRPLEGKSMIAIKNSIEKTSDLSIKAEPFFTNRNSVLSGLTLFSWTIDGKKIIDNLANSKGILNLSIPETREDNVSMTVDVIDSLNRYQSKVSKTFNLEISDSYFFSN